MNTQAKLEIEQPQVSEAQALVPQQEAPPPVVQQPPSMLNFIASALENPNIDANKLKALLDMQREVAADDARAQFNRALHEAQAEMPRVQKNGCIDLGVDKNSGKPRGSIPFATWEDVDRAVRPIMVKHGFSVTFSNEDRGPAGIKWTATHRHLAGHQEANSITLPPDEGHGRNSLQAGGSTQSYAKRYLVEAFYNIVRAGVDDDGKRGGTVYIDLDTAAAVHAELARRKIPFEAFCEVLGVRSIEEIEVKNLPAARNALKAYKPRVPDAVP